MRSTCLIGTGSLPLEWWDILELVRGVVAQYWNLKGYLILYLKLIILGKFYLKKSITFLYTDNKHKTWN